MTLAVAVANADVFVGKADIGGGSKILLWKFAPVPTSSGDLAPLLRRIIAK
ncbi:hypothetical protein [Mesorhizobium sp. WSM4887]|uniref:hypothetical protein n=1 Tax=Mesorhizobium sp. WSM4887 TaxID=3038543 RepID=UPI002416F327|nr:hypothetical protein [Mesorhizobium sp. WSM4887]MDG4889289.1 hypothetical protein [Mesorhizobium sp. WSM4887]